MRLPLLGWRKEDEVEKERPSSLTPLKTNTTPHTTGHTCMVRHIKADSCVCVLCCVRSSRKGGGEGGMHSVALLFSPQKTCSRTC